MKLTPDNLASKLGKRVDLKTTKELFLPNMQIDEISTFSRMESLERIDLSGNWFRFTRQIEKLFEAPNLKEIDFTGCAVCKTANYRYFVIGRCKNLEILDKKEISSEERCAALKFLNSESEDPAVILAREQQEKNEAVAHQLALESEKARVQTENEERRKKKEAEDHIQKGQQEREKQEWQKRKQLREQIGDQNVQQKTESGEEIENRETISNSEQQQNQQPLPKTINPEPNPCEDSEPTEVTEFKDSRSTLVISNKLTSQKNLKTKGMEPQTVPTLERKLLSENSLFGETKQLEIKRKGDVSSLFSDNDDLFKQISLKENLHQPMSQKIEEEDLLLSSRSNTKKSMTNNDLDGDLFSLVDKKTIVQDPKPNDFDVDDFVAKLRNQTQRALFDD